MRFARAICYNSLVRLRGGHVCRDAGLDLYYTPWRRVARDRRHANSGVRQGRVATSADVRNLAYLVLLETANFQPKGRVCEMRHVCKSRVACLQFVFFGGRLAVPKVEHGFIGTPRSYFAPHRDVPHSGEAWRMWRGAVDAKCPKCGTLYEVAVDEIGTKATCENCHAEFVVGGNKREARPRRIVVSSRPDGKSTSKPGVRSVMPDRCDVVFISPTIAKILEWICYIMCVVSAISCFVMGVLLVSQGDRQHGAEAIVATIIALPLAILIVRLIYEGIVALFEILRHLREIRDKLDLM